MGRDKTNVSAIIHGRALVCALQDYDTYCPAFVDISERFCCSVGVQTFILVSRYTVFDIFKINCSIQFILRGDAASLYGCSSTIFVITHYIYFKHLPPVTYYWTVPLILDHSHLVGKLTSSNLLIQKCQDFRCSKAFISAILEFVKFPTRYEWFKIRRPVQ
jgi:hypothetical protein